MTDARCGRVRCGAVAVRAEVQVALQGPRGPLECPAWQGSLDAVAAKQNMSGTRGEGMKCPPRPYLVLVWSASKSRVAGLRPLAGRRAPARGGEEG